MYLLSVYFDKKTEKQLQMMIDDIASSTGNDFFLKNNVPPHMTISTFEARSEEIAVQVFQRLEQKLHSFEIDLVSAGVFFPYVIYCQPILNQELMELAETVYSILKEMPEIKVSGMYRPYSWIPHVTLGKKLDKEQMQKAFAVMQKRFVPIKAKIERIGISDTNPHRDLKVISVT